MNKQAKKKHLADVVQLMLSHPQGVWPPGEIGRRIGVKRLLSHSLGAERYLAKLCKRGVVEFVRFQKGGFGYRLTAAYLKAFRKEFTAKTEMRPAPAAPAPAESRAAHA